MKLTVVIVSYNVKYFLEQCLQSVFKAASNLTTEIFVVDNNSVDGSVEMVRQKFPSVKVIANNFNGGFSKANNQAMRESTGDYILLLNPDTVVEEDTFSMTLKFMDSHPEAGALGVKMIDGSGKFLHESKRGLPTPKVAFYKIFGLSALFPKSKTFGRYHLGFLDENEIHEVEILAGAFMLIRRTVLDKIGLLDEDFFMYGEDIDLSYRVLKAGYKNYYYPETRIIHYKGESTRRSSVNYVFVFYNAMIIFAKKHFSKSHASLFSFFIRIAIYIRAFTAIVARFLSHAFLPILDFVLVFAGIYVMKNYWSSNFSIRYPDAFLYIVVPVYCMAWIVSIFFSGGYDLPIRPSRIIRGIFSGTLLILIIYALLPEHLRFSRALILLGAFWSSAAIITARLIINIFSDRYKLDEETKKKLIIVGHDQESNRVLSLLKLSETTHQFIGFVSPGTNGDPKDFSAEYSKYVLGKADRLRELIEVYGIDEVIFCGKDVTSQEIINFMSMPAKANLEYKIAPPESLFIIGSNSEDDPGNLYIIDINNINNRVNRRNKRFFDIVMSLCLLVLSPLIVFLTRNPGEAIKNIFRVFSGRLTWVGYSGTANNHPKIRKGVLTPLDRLNKEVTDDLTIDRLNSLYARDYRVYIDLNIISKGWRNIGRRVS